MWRCWRFLRSWLRTFNEQKTSVTEAVVPIYTKVAVARAQHEIQPNGFCVKHNQRIAVIDVLNFFSSREANIRATRETFWDISLFRQVLRRSTPWLVYTTLKDAHSTSQTCIPWFRDSGPQTRGNIEQSVGGLVSGEERKNIRGRENHFGKQTQDDITHIRDGFGRFGSGCIMEGWRRVQRKSFISTRETRRGTSLLRNSISDFFLIISLSCNVLRLRRSRRPYSSNSWVSGKKKGHSGNNS